MFFSPFWVSKLFWKLPQMSSKRLENCYQQFNVSMSNRVKLKLAEKERKKGEEITFHPSI